MAEMLLINPRKRARRTGSAKRRRASPAQARARSAFAAAARRRRNPIAARRRRRNPISAVRRTMRRANPIHRHHTRRRRRNPIGGGSRLTVNSFLSMFKDAVIGGVGAIGVDVLMGQINPYLPLSLQTNPAKIGAGDAVKAVITVALGKLLSKPSRGMSQKMALGALTTQARDLISTFVPSTMKLGYYSPANLVQGTNRVGPIRQGINAYQKPGSTSLLNAYTQPGRASQLLSGMQSVMEREGVRYS